MNLQLQGDELNLVKSKSVIVAFIKELVLFKQNLGHGHLYQLPNLNRLRDNGEVNDDDMLLYCNHMTMLHTDMCERYADILSMTLPVWILDPFSSVDGADVFLQEELIELQANDELKPKLKNIGLVSFGCSFCGCVSAAVVRTCSNCSLLGAVLVGLTDVVLSLFAELINDSWYCEFNGPISLGDAAGDASEVTADNDSSDCNLSIELGESDSASTSSEAAKWISWKVNPGKLILRRFENVFKEILACTVHNDDSAVEDAVADKWPYETVFDNIRKKKACRQSFRH
uniref:Uncharacterized protein n=1 Tax=Trichuris muris TaxID=70415 RepID=A0A5S6Q1L3_TRIMR